MEKAKRALEIIVHSRVSYILLCSQSLIGGRNGYIRSEIVKNTTTVEETGIVRPRIGPPMSIRLKIEPASLGYGPHSYSSLHYFINA